MSSFSITHDSIPDGLFAIATVFYDEYMGDVNEDDIRGFESLDDQDHALAVLIIVAYNYLDSPPDSDDKAELKDQFELALQEFRSVAEG